MQVDEAKELLNACVREEDANATQNNIRLLWRGKDGLQVAGGIRSSYAGVASVWFTNRDGGDMPVFTGREAKELCRCGFTKSFQRYDHVAMMEGPRRKIGHFNDKHWLLQIGWLGQTGTFYPWPTTPSSVQEPGSYSPVYMEDAD